MAYFSWKSYNGAVDPFDLFVLLEGHPYRFLLESSLQDGSEAGRFSFVGADPYDLVRIDSLRGVEALDGHLARQRVSAPAGPLAFWGGAVGYLSYDAGVWFEPRMCARREDHPDIPCGVFGLYNTIIAIDHWTDKVYIVAHGAPEKSKHAAVRLCGENTAKFEKLLRACRSARQTVSKAHQPAETRQLGANISRDDFCEAVRRAKAYITAGDIYQVNLTQRFEAVTQMSAEVVYERLKRLSPTHFSGLFDAGVFQVISSSPEEFLRVRGNTISTRPMKGTSPRGQDRAQDASFKNQLLRSDKDRAELTMIVDLMRNDLGKICRYGTVQVPALRELETYATVYQTTATVRGELSAGISFGDILGACFPGGSITGCPKVRAMQIIAELESCPRSLYTGCLGYASFCGSLDMNILIRSILKVGERCSFGVGAGIVADSDPSKEYAETLFKARSLMEALGVSHEYGRLFEREVCCR